MGPPLRVSLAALALLLFAGGLGCGNGDGGSGAERVAPEAIASETRTFVDTSRATPPNGTYPGAPDRTIEVRLWYAPEAPRSPACADGGCALVLLAHGFGGSTLRFDAIARDLAGRGYVVAAPRFPLTNEAAPGGHLNGLGDLVAQPGDLSFVVDRLLAAAAESGDPLSGRIDGERIGAVGHSLGGAAVIALTRLACCTDPRVDAVVGVAPAAFIVAGVFGEEIAREGPPMLNVSGSADPVVRPDLVRALHEEIAPPRLLLEIAGANHVNMIENTGPPSPMIVPTGEAAAAFFATYLGGEVDGLAASFDELAADGHAVDVDL